ncbi:bacteriocin-processing peptidase [Chitinophaga niastensis]|uniref:Bacteriocin-processing peptidase n=1 Tax=Chitinophaga niastensis TaxID=536980 RepID=A0A2P8HEQ3_CHINA|nr:peptidase domain-containing ABC transporter [Chitinophaga niastensis]PSL44703.1 bacteriocin-processing peptidase [Chitinophaga niastensis]
MIFRSFPNERQYDKMDCGPTCLKLIARHYGTFYSLQYLRDKCGITRQGVTLLDLSHAAENIGLRTLSIKATVQLLYEKVPLPCIIHWNNSHFIVVYKVGRKKVYVSDPAAGLLTYTYEEFVNNWYPAGEDAGILLALEPQANFKQYLANEKIEKRKTFQHILAYFTPYKKSFLNLFVVMLFVTGLQGLLPFISKAVIDVGIQTRDITFINIVLFANIVILVSVMLSNAARDWILLHVTARLNIALISDYLIKLMKLPVTFFETKLTGDILQRANDHERIRSFITNNSISLIFSTLTFIVFSIILLTFDPIIFSIFLVGSVVYIGWVLLFIKVRKKLDWEYFELNAKNQSYWVETIEGMQDIKVNNYEKSRRWKWENIQARLYKVNRNVLSINNVQQSGAQFIDNIKNLTITFYCAKAVVNDRITFGVMISTQFIIGMLNTPVSQFIQFVISAQFAKISFMRLNEIHQLDDEDEEVGKNDIQLSADKNIFVKNVAFQYSVNGQLVLKNIYLNIPQGKVTAIVGDSGSGKSTLMKLLLRLYKPSYGEIIMGGLNINNINLKQWRSMCGVVMQDGKIFSETILNNIIMADDKVDFVRFRHAVETANIATEIEQLPLGYETIIGETGRGLSGGQRQRILIARALYKNPDFLFFDEATNALDTINEQKIVDALDKAFTGKTVVVIAHRLSTIRKADQIIVMQQGGIVEIGSHETLIEKKGRYFQLVQSQGNITLPSYKNEDDKSIQPLKVTEN